MSSTKSREMSSFPMNALHDHSIELDSDPAWEIYVPRCGTRLSQLDNHLFLRSIDWSSAARVLIMRDAGTSAAFFFHRRSHIRRLYMGISRLGLLV